MMARLIVPSNVNCDGLTDLVHVVKNTASVDVSVLLSQVRSLKTGVPSLSFVALATQTLAVPGGGLPPL